MSVTTRKPRPGEVDGVHYHFVDDAEFDRLRGAGELLEWAVVHGRASTARRAARSTGALAEGRMALLEIDLQGARQVRERMPEALFVFLAPPSWDELVRRLVGRGTEDRGGARASGWPPRGRSWPPSAEFDVTIVNDDVRRASEELVALMRAPSSTAPHDGQRPVTTPTHPTKRD